MICMRKEIISPAQIVQIPDSPILRLDNFCSYSDGNFVDKLGNLYSCATQPLFWSNGFSSAAISIGKSLLNHSNCSISFFIQIRNNNSKIIVSFGNILENGLWVECKENILFVKDNSGVLFFSQIKKSLTLGFTKEGTIIRFYLNGVFQSELTRSINTENSTTITVASKDRMNNFIAYDKTLTDSQMNDLHLLFIQGSSGVDRWGYMTSKQTFSMET